MTETKHVPLSVAIVNAIHRSLLEQSRASILSSMICIMKIIEEVEILEGHDDIAKALEGYLYIPNCAIGISRLRNNLAKQKQRALELSNKEEDERFSSLLKSVAKIGSALDMETEKYLSEKE